MKNQNTEPLIIVTNPNSTRARAADADVIRPLQEAGIDFIRLDTRYAKAEDNEKDLAERLPAKATVVNASGDGVAEQLTNVALSDEKDLTLAIVPQGNYNDTAGAHMRKGQSVLDFLGNNVPTVYRTPISIEVNGEHLVNSFSYVTMGLTALVAAGFRDEASRERLRNSGDLKRKVVRYGQAGIDYLKYVGKKLPDFRVDGGGVQSGRTDIAFANNPTVAGLLRFPDTYYDKPYFGARTDLDMGSIRDLVTFGVASVMGRAPLERVETMQIAFEETARDLPFQSGGEYQEIDADEIFAYKDASKRVTYLHPKALPRS